jgi:hypothetical protein
VRWVAQRDPVGIVFGGHDGSGVWSSIEELTGLWQRAAGSNGGNAGDES